MNATKSLVIGFGLLCLSLGNVARADELLFTLTGPDGNASWTQSSDPVPIAGSYVTGEFTVINVTANGNDSNNNPISPVMFFAPSYFGGLCTNGLDYPVYGYACAYGSTISEVGPQIYSGSEAAPIFSVGTFDFDVLNCDDNGCDLGGPNGETLTVSEVPEPGTLALFSMALLALGGPSLRRKFV